MPFLDKSNGVAKAGNWQIIDGCRAGYAGKAGEFRLEPVPELQSGSFALVSRFRQRKRKADEVVDIKSGVLAHYGVQATNHQAGSGEQHDGDGEFADYQTISQPHTTSSGGTARLFFESFVLIGLGKLPCGQKAECDGGDKSDGQKIAKGREIQMDRAEKRHGFANILRNDGQEQANSPMGYDDPENSSRHRQQDTLGQQLADDLQPSCAESDANRNLLLSGGGTSQHEMGDIGAGHQQYEGHRDREHQKQRTNVADDEFAQTLDVNLDGGVFLWMSGRQGRIDRLHFGSGLCLGDSWRETADNF